MTLFLDFRSNDTGGAVLVDPKGLETSGASPGGATLRSLDWIGSEADGKRVLFAVHGFNTGWLSGLRSAVHLEADLKSLPAPHNFTSQDLLIGVLWPGDWWVKVVNYPWEAFDAVHCGQRLAAAINTYFTGARSVSFVSHSLGARVILSAAAQVAGEDKVEHIILTAPAADNNCLVGQHAAACGNARQVHVLSSKRDNTLKFAYPVGDFLSDIFGDDDDPFTAALGYRGPKPPSMKAMLHVGIAGKPRNQKNNPSLTSDYDHGDYFPASDAGRPSVTKSHTVSSYIGAAFQGQQRWP